MRTTQRLVFLLLWLLMESNAIPLPAEDSSEKKAESINNDRRRECRKGAVDLAFVIDESGSITSADFHRTLLFLANLTNSMEVGPARDQSQVAFVKFSDEATLVFDLNDHPKTKQQLQNDIIRISTTQVKNGTKIASGMNKATSTVFTPDGGDRSEVPNVMLVLTDGEDNSNVTNAYRAAAAKNITVYVIGVGNAVNKAQLEAIVGGKPKHVYDVSGFNALDSLLSEICIETPLEVSAAFPWSSVLPALIAIPLALIIFAAICLTIVPLRKRLTRDITTAVTLDATVLERSPLTSETAEQGDMDTPDVSLPALLPPLPQSKPQPADRKPRPVDRKPRAAERKPKTVLSVDITGHTEESKAESRTADKIYRLESAADSSKLQPPNSKDVDKDNDTNIPEKKPKLPLLPPIKSQIVYRMSSDAEGQIKNAERKQQPSSPPATILAPSAEALRKVDQVHSPNITSDGTVNTAERRRRQALLPPTGTTLTRMADSSRNAEKVRAHDSNTDADAEATEKKQALLSSSPTADISLRAERIFRPDSEAGVKTTIQHRDKRQALLPPMSEKSRIADRVFTPESSAGADIKTTQSDISENAVIFRKNGSVALKNERESSSDAFASHESADFSKPAAILRHERETAPSVFLDNSVTFGTEDQSKVAEIRKRESAFQH